METEWNDAIHWLQNRLRFGIKPGLERMQYMLEQMGHPERRIKTIHVAGTNGKGSTVSFMRHVLQEAGYEVGTFTSPYITSLNERISVNGVPISKEDFVTIVERIKPVVEKCEKTAYGAPTEFEVLTMIALEYFAKYSFPYIAIFEVGLGGRFDSTNVILPILSIITNIGKDHMNILGNTIAEIAEEKAGIIKSGVPVITGVKQQEALEVIEKIANAKHAKLYRIGKEFRYQQENLHEGKETFSFQSFFQTYEQLEISLKGEHQIQNAAVALMALEYLRQYFSFVIEEEHIRTGLFKTEWAGRFEKISDHPLIIIDGAHNPDGIHALKQTISRHYPNQKIHFIFSAMKDKSLNEMIAQVDSIAEKIVFTQFDYPRCAKAKDLYELSHFTNKIAEENWQEAIKQEIEEVQKDKRAILMITGSLYFISKVREYLNSK